MFASSLGAAANIQTPVRERARHASRITSTLAQEERSKAEGRSSGESTRFIGLATYCCPCGPHRRATVAGLGLVGGAVRPSQDAPKTLAHQSERTIVYCCR